ncbi:phosphohistidine phosphatase SixA [Leptospira perolatii]|uniref:Phosphohistidine phosphatase SixA n=1 Tax=Leptospira perolatii TaxID=2023191 RepID=A0A2M9ZS17_9LEPT|nr:phosphohistidine phosphatase SixA [Leptospira perolatii]PJZ71354.1 phosphohistidine phosphatase SixA [Leptospira perolatii]PJZ74888.1 phosphohistidine phosphatase SixA [Leptospira perolatii]
MKIIIARHGEAEPASDDGKDSSRELTQKGKEDAEKMATFLQTGFHIKKIFHSPFLRTMKTAEIYSRILKPELETESTLDLAPGENYGGILPRLKEYSNSDAILIVGHSPDVSIFAERLLGISGVGKSFLFTPGSALAINVPREKMHDGQIIWFVSPDFLCN